MNHLDYITKKCHEANPKLLELSFGCRIWNTIFVWILWQRCFYRYQNGSTDSYIMPNGVPDHWEILWHPIQLSDILMALGRDYAVGGDWWFLKAGKGCTFCWTGSDCMRHHYVMPKFLPVVYDLSKPLSEQSPETIQWISEQLWYSSIH